MPWDPRRTDILPVLPVADVPFPGTCQTLMLPTLSSYGAVREASRAPDPLLAAFTSDAEGGLYTVGALARVQRLHQVGGHWCTEIRMLTRARRVADLRLTPYPLAAVEQLGEASDEPGALQALAVSLKRAAERLPPAARFRLRHASLEDVPGIVLTALRELDRATGQRALESESLAERLAMALAELAGRDATAPLT